MNIILVPILGWLLAIAYNSFEELISKNENVINKHRIAYSIIVFYVMVLIVQYNAFRNKLYDKYWIWLFRHVASKDVLFIIFAGLAFVIIWILLNLASKINFQSPGSLGIILSLFIVFSTLDMESVGANMWIYPAPLATPTRYRLNVAQLNMESFTAPRIEPGTLSLSSAFSVGNKETKRFNWYFNRYIEFLENTEDQLSYRRKLLGIVDGRRLYFSKAIDYLTVEGFLEDASQFNNFERVISYTGDELVLNVSVTTEGYLSFIDNWDSDWEAILDSKPTKIALLFGTFKSVKIPPGEHRLIFAYRPKLFNIFAKKLKSSIY
jgi:hypothetical protein